MCSEHSFRSRMLGPITAIFNEYHYDPADGALLRSNLTKLRPRIACKDFNVNVQIIFVGNWIFVGSRTWLVNYHYVLCSNAIIINFDVTTPFKLKVKDECNQKCVFMWPAFWYVSGYIKILRVMWDTHIHLLVFMIILAGKLHRRPVSLHVTWILF